MVSKLPKHTHTLFKPAYQKKRGKKIETERQNMKREETKNETTDAIFDTESHSILTFSPFYSLNF